MEIRQISNTTHFPIKKQGVANQEKQAIRTTTPLTSEQVITTELNEGSKLQEVVEGVNQFFNTTKTHLHFELHEGLNKYYVEIRNSLTNEVIKEIPSKKFLDMVAKLQELAGLVIDEKI